MHIATAMPGRTSRSRHRTGRVVARALALLIALLVLAGCSGQAGRAKAPYPERKTITWIVPYEAGGNTDAISRTVADAMSRDLGQKVVVENKPGGSGAIGMQNLRAAKPDGYTIGLFTSGTMVVSPLANGLDYNPHSFTNIGLMLTQPVMLLTNPNSKYQSFAQLIDAARANPEQVTIGVPGATTPQAYEFTRMGRDHQVGFTVVPFNSNAEVTKAMLGGTVDAVALNVSADVEKSVKAGKYKPLAIGEKQRLPGFPEVPTFAESGFSELTDSGTLIGVSAPAGVPDPVRSRLEEALAKALTDQRAVALLGKDNIPQPFVGSQQVTAQLDQRWDVYKRLVKEG